MSRTGRKLLLGSLLLFGLLVGGASLFLAAHPRCPTCDRRYGPWIPHPYRHTTEPLKHMSSY